MVMSFPFVRVIEKNERDKKSREVYPNKANAITELKNPQQKQKEKCPEKYDMISNLEYFSFYTSTSRCLLDDIKRPTPKAFPPNYDKYFEYFE